MAARGSRQKGKTKIGVGSSAAATRTGWKPSEEAVNKALARLKADRIRWVDLHFIDIPGYLQHITIPVSEVDFSTFYDGVPKLDGSSIKGFKEIHESDMVMMPDPSTYAKLPFYNAPHDTARFIVDIAEGGTKEPFVRDPRGIARKASEFAASQGYDNTYWGPELEFFVFDKVKLTPTWSSARDAWAGSGYEIQSREAAWGGEGSTYPIRFKEGYYPAPPQDTLQDYRNEVCRILTDSFGIVVDAHHHEVATAGQCEISIRYNELVATGDAVLGYKYVAKMVAHQMGMIATFMPKPIFGDNASGMHVHQSLWTHGKNTFYDADDSYAELSQTGRYYIGGLLHHARSLCAFTNPTTNSYRRLVPGYEAPVYIAWSKRNRSANVRIPMYVTGVEHAKRCEYRTPDPSANIYLAFSAMLCAGIDGVKKKIDPGNPVDEDIYKLTPERRVSLGVRELPGSLAESIDELESDHDFLKPVMPPELLDKYIELKRNDHLQTALRPTPYEFYSYLDI